MATGLEGVAAKARGEAKLQFTSLCHHISRELIWESLCSISKASAPGVDGVTVERAKEDFGVWVEEMLRSVHRKVDLPRFGGHGVKHRDRRGEIWQRNEGSTVGSSRARRSSC